MKQGYKNLLSVLGAIGLVMPFAGCETDAEEAQDRSKNGVAANNGITTNNSAAATVGTISGGSKEQENSSTSAAPSSSAQTNSPSVSDTGTNTAVTATSSASETNSVTNQQTVILNRIPPAAPANVKLSKGVEEIVKLAQAGLSETVMLLYVDKSTEPFDLDAAELIYLNDIGIPSTVLAGMLNHDGKGEDILHDALDTNNVQVATAPAPSVAPQPAPQQMEVSSNYVATAPQPGGAVLAQDPYAQAQQPVVVEQQPAVIVQQPAVTYSYFYSSLSPYGSWVQLPDYGWCWQPTIAISHRGWRPYLHGGRWLSSDVGWYWHSDYSWGWAPFHYGRWYCAPRVGWVWTPDYTWGPSWVTWRRTGDYCGWAPLPPRCDVRPGFGFSYWGHDVGFNFSFGYTHDFYAWVPAGRFCDRRLTDHVVHTDRASRIYRDSTVVNNYIVGNNNTIVNNGIGRDFVRSHTGSELPRVRVAESATAGRLVQPDRLRREGAENVVYRPARPSPTLVRAHEQTETRLMARSQTETARPTGATADTGGRNSLVPARPMRPEPLAPSRGDSQIQHSASATTPRGTAVPVIRGETARPRLATRDVPAPVFGTPAPVRPEPDRSAEILRSRSAQETRIRPSTSIGGGLVTTRPQSTVVRPISPNNSIAPRFNAGGDTSTSQGVQGTTRAEVARPGSTITSPAPDRSVGRTEVVRPPTTPSGRPIWNQRSITQPNPSTPARSPDLASPQVTRPAPVTSPRGESVSRSTPATPRGVINQSPQPIQRQAPVYQRPTAAPRPNVIQRNETFSRPSVSSTPSITRSAPQVARPQVSAPTYSAPAPVRSAPSRPSISSAPINGGNFRSAPPAAAPAPSVSRPSQPAPSSSGPSRPSSGGSGRGRVEVGR